MKRIGWIHAALCTLIIVLAIVLRLCVVYMVKVSGDNCNPSLLCGDRVAVLRQAWCDTAPKRGDWVVFTHPYYCDCLFAGCIMAVPGDTLWIGADGQLSDRSNASDLVVVPQANQILQINMQNMRLYNQAIMQHEPVHSAIVDEQLYVSGEAIDNYRFTKSYYWIKTNCPDSDSRMLGLVPVCRIKGTMQRVLCSHDPTLPLWRGWRWRRIGKKP